MTTAGDASADRPHAPQADSDEAAFHATAQAHLAGMFTTAMCYLGDRLGLFRDLAEHGPATSMELAHRTGLVERYVREWLYALSSAGYLAYDEASGQFALPEAHRAVLAEEDHPRFLGGWFQVMMGELQVVAQVAHAFRDGGGVAPAAYPHDLWDGEARTSTARFRTALVQDWMPRLPAVAERLERGASLADVGCGEGEALLVLAHAYPGSRFLGVDPSAAAIARAAQRAEAAGVADRVAFRVWDDTQSVPTPFGPFDVVTTFTVVHDAAFPGRLIQRIHDALQPDGVYVCRDMTGEERFDPSGGMDGLMSHAENILYCMTTALALGGEGMGQLGLTATRFRQLCQAAGFLAVERIPLDDPGVSLYLATP